MMIDVAEAIDYESVNVRHASRNRDSYDNSGNVQKGSQTVSQIQAAVQPASGNSLKDFPEGIHDQVTLVCWSRKMVNNDELIDSVEGYEGQTFKIVHVMKRPSDGFCKFAIGLCEEEIEDDE